MFKVLLIIFLIYLAIRWLTKPLLRYAIERMAKKMAEQHGFNTNNQEPIRPRKKEGTIDIDYIPNNQKKSGKSPSEGEYVDYEEVK
ncbi:MAG: DUF4834 family protein [Sporocytophaga sp.]|uniref:DUF4834 family protein n=1 Tax=Sporocytophaga sp. TaxID=2231183 RepID=UPI001B245A6A|nr:DUF4834 family protein [Sporocytophaga sp.]MBO9701501.1 DUF4834 family protein [Sporocytophaga sp.]